MKGRNYLLALRSLATHLISLGIDLRKLFLLRYLAKFLRQRRAWKSQGGKITKNHMVLSDFKTSAGVAKGHYFHQDLLVAQFIFKDKPKRHIDIASRIDGFVAHVASFRKLEILDIRSLPKSNHSNIEFIQADLLQEVDIGQTDSISCLHAIEHFGLGRYSDKIDVNGHKSGIKNIINILAKGGKMYLSVPVSTRDQVHFNAHRIFATTTLPQLPIIKNNMVLERFDLVDDNGDLHVNENISKRMVNLEYGCGIYTFRRVTDTLVY